jgi:hypothetical protein
MPKGGFEPPLPCENCALNAARLPISPLRLGTNTRIRDSVILRPEYMAGATKRKRFLSESPKTVVRVEPGRRHWHPLISVTRHDLPDLRIACGLRWLYFRLSGPLSNLRWPKLYLPSPDNGTMVTQSKPLRRALSGTGTISTRSPPPATLRRGNTTSPRQTSLLENSMRYSSL